MKKALYILSFFLTLNLFGQKLTKRVGKIQVKLIIQHIKRDYGGVMHKHKLNKRKRPYSKVYFDSSGLLLKTIQFGKYQDINLKLLDNIHIYQYHNNRVKKKVDIWETDNFKKLSHTYYKLFDYDSIGVNMVSKKTYSVASDSLSAENNYWYNKNNEFQGEKFDSTYYYKRAYNKKGKLINLQQIYESKVRWEWNYTYSNNQRIGILQKYYDDGIDNSKKESLTYNVKKLLIEREEVSFPFSLYNIKTKIFYDQNGVISKIEEYEQFERYKEDYKLISVTTIKIKTKTTINGLIAKNINDQIYNIEEKF